MIATPGAGGGGGFPPSIRSVLAGFAGLLLLMAFLAADSALQTRDVARESAALRRESRHRDAILDRLRSDTYRSATLVRDYMLERDEWIAASQRTELLRLRRLIEEGLARYSAKSPPNEVEAVRSLQVRVDAYWSSLAPALAWDLAARRERGEPFLRNTLVPKRDEMVDFMKQVTELNERVLDAAEERIQQVQAEFQDRVRGLSILALTLGVILAFFVVRHARQLSAESALRFQEALAAREDLRRLSDRLISVQEEERRNLSRELHDDLGQTMSAMLLEIGKLESPGSMQFRERLAPVRRLAEENVAKVRNMALLLRPAMLDELGLVPALRWHAREISRRTGLKVKMMADELHDDLPDASRTCIYRVVQEALNNCVRHANASEARVVIHRDAGGLSVSVQDNGVGFDPAHNKGLGLLGMTERVTGLGGRFHVDSEPGRGAILSAYFLLDNDRCRPEDEGAES
jgi:signal transduction histidine kinase